MSGLDVPGLAASDPNLGNLGDVGKAGSLQNFLIQLHKDNGDIASFFFGPLQVVSIASPKLFEEHSHVFDRPIPLFALFQDFIGKESLQYANGEDGKKRRGCYDKCFENEALKAYYDVIQKKTDEIVKKLQGYSSGDKMPTTKTMMDLSVRILSVVAFGDFFEKEENVSKLQECYEMCWYEMEMRLINNIDPVRIEKFNKSLQDLKDLFSKALEERKGQTGSSKGHLYIDALLQGGFPTEVILADCLIFLVASFHTSAMALTWTLYYLATNPDIQQRAATEATSVGKIGAENICQCKYIKQVVQESLRMSVLVPYVGRFQDVDSQLGGHNIPANTPIIQALGVVLHDEKYYPDNNRFDPDRFTVEKMASLPKLAFEPFGFAGKRQCIGYQFAYVEFIIILSTLLKNFRFDLDLDLQVKCDHGLVTKPQEEIMMSVVKRE